MCCPNLFQITDALGRVQPEGEEDQREITVHSIRLYKQVSETRARDRLRVARVKFGCNQRLGK